PSHRPPPSFPTRRSSDLFKSELRGIFTIRVACRGSSRSCFESPTEAILWQYNQNFYDRPGTIRNIPSINLFYFRSKERRDIAFRSEEHTSELQSRENLVC